MEQPGTDVNYAGVTFFSEISPYRTEFFSGRPHDQMEKDCK